MERHLATVLEAVADAVGERTAVVQGDVRRSWKNFEDRSARLAAAFLDAGVAPGSKVALYLYNSPAYLESHFAALKVRAVPVNVNYRYLDEELRYLLENAEAEVLVFHASLGERVAKVRDLVPGVKAWIEVDDLDGAPAPWASVALPYEVVIAANDPAPRIERDPADITMTYTGGTTGLPKGVMSPVGPALDALMSAAPPMIGEAPITDPADMVSLARRFAAEDRAIVGLPACPLMHATGLTIGSLPSLMLGGTVVLLARPGLDVDELWDLVERERVLSLTVVGDAFARPLLHGLDAAEAAGQTRDLSSLAVILSSGAMFSTEVKRALHRHLPSALIVDFIASTEAPMGASYSSIDNPAVTGRFTPGPGVTVFDADDHQVVPGSGVEGVVAVPGAVTLGYFGDQAKTDRTFREIDGVRYAFPGDWATIEADGAITLLGRGSQCINTGGEKVFPEEVEEALKRHPAVEDALVFGIDDERFGQRVVAVISPAAPTAGATDLDAAEVVDSLRATLSSYKLPRRITVVDEVPRAPNGKADYPAARGLLDLPA